MPNAIDGKLLGAVLAGGRSSRFGSDKARALLDGRTLADRAGDALAPFVDAVILVGGADGVADLPTAGLGPLGGIAGAIDHAARCGYRGVVTIACDMPIVPRTVMTALVRRAPAYCIEAPVLGHWPSALGAHLIAWLERDCRRSVRGWARAVGALPIAAGVGIANVNTPADLRSL